VMMPHLAEVSLMPELWMTAVKSRLHLTFLKNQKIN